METIILIVILIIATTVIVTLAATCCLYFCCKGFCASVKKKKRGRNFQDGPSQEFTLRNSSSSGRGNVLMRELSSVTYHPYPDPVQNESVSD